MYEIPRNTGATDSSSVLLGHVMWRPFLFHQPPAYVPGAPPTKPFEVLKCQKRNPKKVPRTNAELMDGRMGGWDVTLKALGTKHASF